jgi:hypothetical protein
MSKPIIPMVLHSPRGEKRGGALWSWKTSDALGHPPL